MIEKIMSVLNDEEQNQNQSEDKMSGGNSTMDVPDRDRKYRDMIAPTTFIENSRYARSGKDNVRVLFVLNWPDEPRPMFLEQLLYRLPVNSDISLHVSPRDKGRAVRELEKKLEKAQSRSNDGVTASTQQANQERLKNTQRMYNSIKGDSNLHEISMYIAVRADDEDSLELAVEQVVRELRKNGVVPEVLADDQKDGMRSVSPICRDVVNYKNPSNSAAVATMYPFGTTTVSEVGGIDVGEHDINSSPVTIRRFERENGYNQITAGKIGSGKTFGTLLEILRSKAAHGEDLVIYMLDPLSGFKPILDLLGGKEVAVGGNTRINPMRITETPQEAFDEVPDLDPYSEKISQLMDFFEMYFELQDRELGDSRDILSLAIEEAYKAKGIQRDPSTHSNESPTIQELRSILRKMEDNPGKYAKVDDPEDSELVNRIEEHASRLVLSLGEFEDGGQYENLGKKTTLSLEQEDVVYFNLSQQEGTGSLGLMMHILLSEVYEQAKKRDEKILFCIDEAHYIMSDAKSLDFLEQAVRHSRHYDLGINFITQTLQEFFSHRSSEAIAQQCSMRRIHKIESGLTEDIKDTLNLKESHISYIQSAAAGDEDKGYSQALYGVDQYGYIPVKIRPSPFEINVISQAEERLDVNG